MKDIQTKTGKKRYRIKVYSKETGCLKATIYRTLKAEQVGNFNLLYCNYLGLQHLVKSTVEDLSDPFRLDESIKGDLFIEVL